VNTNKEILKKLEELEKQEGTLPQYLELYRQLLLIQTDAKKDVPSTNIVLTTAETENALKNGIPLLKWDAIPIDWTAFQRLAQAAAGIIVEHSNAVDKSLKKIVLDIPLLQQMAKAWYESSSLAPWADNLGIDEVLLSAVIDCAMKPFLVAQARNLMQSFPQESWRRGYCPVCGGKPDFACLDRERGARWLVCSRCDSEWLFQRLMCPYCGNDNQSDLAYYTDDKGLYRLYICQRCRTYLKAIDLRHMETEVLIPLERVLTVDMDRQGQEKGYKGI
jgi:formate dehydrogenase accessory protein FdhE